MEKTCKFKVGDRVRHIVVDRAGVGTIVDFNKVEASVVWGNWGEHPVSAFIENLVHVTPLEELL